MIVHCGKRTVKHPCSLDAGHDGDCDGRGPTIKFEKLETLKNYDRAFNPENTEVVDWEPELLKQAKKRMKEHQAPPYIITGYQAIINRALNTLARGLGR